MIIISKMSKYSQNPKLWMNSEQQDYEVMQPMIKKHPPNEIISEKYAPDITPQMRLITNKDSRKNNVNFLPPKIKHPELQTYASLFNQLDYLGHYCSNKINQIVYMKFNNNPYNLVPEAKFKTRIMPAFYLPFQQLHYEHDTFFTKHIGLHFPDTGSQALYPTAKDNRGCSFDPLFSSNFQSGNLFAVIRKAPFEYELILQNDINSCLEVAWFNFSVEFCEEGYYSFRIKNITKNMTKLFEQGMKISYCSLQTFSQKSTKNSGEGWSLCGQNISFTQTKIQIQSKPGDYYYQLYFQFRCKNKHDIAMFSLQCPYTTLDAQRFFNKVMFKKVKGMTRVERIQFGKTISGSPLNAYLIKKKKSGSDSVQLTPQQSQVIVQMKQRKSINLLAKTFFPNDTRTKSIVIIGRLGGADVNSSYVIQGMVDYLLDSLDYQSLKKTINFYFIPLANIDCVKYGSTLTNLTGTNLFSEWKHPHKLHQAEIYYLKEFLNEIHKENPISLVVNLATQNQELYSSMIGAKNEFQDCQDSRIFPYVLSRRNRMISFENSYFYQKNSNHFMPCVLGEMFPKALTYQFNISRFELASNLNEVMDNLNYQQMELRQCSIQSYQSLGREILSNYLEHVKLYDKNILLRDKWTREIEQIQNTITKKQPKTLPYKPVETRFNLQFYSIKCPKQNSTMSDIKSHKKLQTNYKSKNLIQNERAFHIPRLSKKPKLSARLPNSFNQLLSKRVYNGMAIDTKTEIIDHSQKQTEQENKNIDKSFSDKPMSLFRIAEKTHSILRNCQPTTLNFQVGGTRKPGKRDSALIQKQLLKKQLQTKMVKKIKIEDTIKERINKEKLGDILNAS